MIQSGVIPVSSMALHRESTSMREPTQNLMPTGLPSAPRRTRSTNSSSSRGVENSGCAAGEITSWPIGTSRVSAIFRVTFDAGSTPPIPGLAPWLILMSTPLTCGRAALRAKTSSSKRPSSVRHPKYPEPNSQMMSAPCSRWYSLSPPSPVSWENPPRAAPLFMASTALADRAPKLIEEMLNREISYGRVQSGPPRRWRGSSSITGTGDMVWRR